MIDDTIFLTAIKEGFWYIDGDGLMKASPSQDTFFISYTCKTDSEYYGIPNQMIMRFATPWRNNRIIFTIKNYGTVWALTREELYEKEHD